MRKLIVTGIISLDGYFDGAGGNVWAMPMDGFFEAHNLERMRAADTLLLGPGTYRVFKGFWPPIAENPALSPAVRQDPSVATTIVRRADAHAAVAQLKKEPGRDILMFGSRLVWNDLLAAGLVDELHLMMAATVLGAGSPAFTVPIGTLRLFDVQRRDGSQHVVLRYLV